MNLLVAHNLAGHMDPRDLKTALFCISFPRKGEVLAYVGRIHNLKDKFSVQQSTCLEKTDLFAFPGSNLVPSPPRSGMTQTFLVHRVPRLP